MSANYILKHLWFSQNNSLKATINLWIRMYHLHNRHQSPHWTKWGYKLVNKQSCQSLFQIKLQPPNKAVNKKEHYMDQPAAQQTEEVALLHLDFELSWSLKGSHSASFCKPQRWLQVKKKVSLGIPLARSKHRGS